jgi:hypothetical protein
MENADPKIIFCYIYVLGKREPLKSAISSEIDDYEQENYWIGVELNHRSYKLSVRDMNEFLNKYLKKG